MDVVDRDLERAEFEATRTFSQSSKEKHEAQRRPSHASSDSSSSTSSDLDMNRTATASGVSNAGVARTRTAGGHPIELHRTATHRLQQTHTVGASLRSKKIAGEKPLPEFGGGKPYPPPLPAAMLLLGLTCSSTSQPQCNGTARKAGLLERQVSRLT